jgi:hypothetical protein
MDLYVQIALGGRREATPWPLDAEASALWDPIVVQVRDILDRGDGLTTADELRAAEERLLGASVGAHLPGARRVGCHRAKYQLET